MSKVFTTLKIIPTGGIGNKSDRKIGKMLIVVVPAGEFMAFFFLLICLSPVSCNEQELL